MICRGEWIHATQGADALAHQPSKRYRNGKQCNYGLEMVSFIETNGILSPYGCDSRTLPALLPL